MAKAKKATPMERNVQAHLERAALRKQRQVEMDACISLMSRHLPEECIEDYKWMYAEPCSQDSA